MTVVNECKHCLRFVCNREIFIIKEIKLVIYEDTPMRLNNPKINEINNSISINKPIYLP